MTQLATITILLLTAGTWAADPTEQFLTALRENRLDALLEAYCRRELASDAAGPRTGALAIELSHALARRAAETQDAAERDKTWNESREVLANAAKKIGDPLGRAQLELHQAALLYAQGEWLRQWEALQGHSDEAPSAVEPLELALALTHGLCAQIEESLEEKTEGSTSASERNLYDRWMELSRQAHLRLGLIRTSLARSLPVNDPSRQEQFQLAIEDLRPLVSPPSAIAAPAVLTLSDALRGLGLHDEAIQVLGALEGVSLDRSTRDRALAEHVEALLSQGRTLDALAILYPSRQPTEDAAPLPAESEYLYLKVLLRQANEMRDDPDAVGKLQASALQQMRRLEALGDPLWIRQAEVLLRQHAQDLLLRETSEYRQAAEALARTGDFAEAADVYLRAARQAEQKSNESDAMDLFQAAARYWEQAGDYEKARDTLSDIEQRWPEHPAAAETLLRAAVDARRAYLVADSQENYTRLNQLARRHQERFPDDSTAGEIRYLVGSLRHAEHKYEESMRQFLAIPPDHRLHKHGILAASRSIEAWKQPFGESTDDIQSAVTFLEGILQKARDSSSADGDAAKQWSADDLAELQLRLSRFLLDPRSGESQKARRHLEKLLQQPEIRHERRLEAQALLILAMVHDLEFTKAQTIAAELPPSKESDLLYLVEILNRRAEDVGDIERRMIGRVQEILIARMDEGSLSNPKRPDLRSTMAQLQAQLNLGDGGASAEVSRQLEELQKAHPRDASVLELLAISHGRQGKPALAIPLWRDLVRGLPERSPEWLRAKLCLVRALYQDGKVKEARDTLRLFETLHPDLGGPSFEEKFQAEHKRLFDADFSSK